MPTARTCAKALSAKLITRLSALLLATLSPVAAALPSFAQLSNPKNLAGAFDNTLAQAATVGSIPLVEFGDTQGHWAAACIEGLLRAYVQRRGAMQNCGAFSTRMALSQ